MAIAINNLPRPKTRGELRNRLANGEICEVVSSNVDITSILLRGWLQFNNFAVEPSDNIGWSLFNSTKGDIENVQTF
jgi:hypothetical protein